MTITINKDIISSDTNSQARAIFEMMKSKIVDPG